MKYLIDFVDSVSNEEITAYFTQHGCSVLTNYQNFEKVYLVDCSNEPPKTDIVVFVVNDDETPLQLLNVKDQTLQYESVDAQDEKNWWKIYGCADFNFEDSSVVVPRKGKFTKVYILDSGINLTHAEFTGVDISLLYSVVDNFTDFTGHGTGLASVISGNTCGLTKSKLGICKIFDPSQETKQSQLLSAFDAVINDFSLSSNPGVVNLSWCIPRNSYIEEKIRTLISRGIVVVAAAGNSGTPIDNVTPAAMEEVLTIGSYDQDFNPSNFSDYTGSILSLTEGETNHGSLDGWAPGEKIYIARPDGSYGYAGGTSLSCAIHSATIAYNLDTYYQENNVIPCLDLQQVNLISTISLKRENFLDLSNPKYQNSVNKISTYDNTPVKFTVVQQYKSTEFDFNFPVKVGETRCKLLFNPENVISFEILNPLPPEFSIINGWLVGKVVNDISENYQLFNSTVKIITNEPNETISINLKISVVKADLTKEDLPSDDPNIPIVFLFYCTDQGCFGPSSLCSGSCPFFTQSCICTDLKAQVCNCGPA